jgi:hypothetical protein
MFLKKRSKAQKSQKNDVSPKKHRTPNCLTFRYMQKTASVNIYQNLVSCIGSLSHDGPGKWLGPIDVSAGIFSWDIIGWKIDNGTYSWWWIN